MISPSPTVVWTEGRPTIPGLYWHCSPEREIRLCRVDDAGWVDWLNPVIGEDGRAGGSFRAKAATGWWAPVLLPTLERPGPEVHLVPQGWTVRPRHPVATASELARVEACPVSALMPRGPRMPRDEHAQRGTVLHRFVEVASLLDRDAALAEMPPDSPHVDTARRLDVESLPPGEPEMGIAWQPETGEVVVLGSSLDRDYSRIPPGTGWIAGTADRMLIDPGAARVVDFKFGWRVPQARGNAQLGMLVGAAAIVADAEEADAEIWSIDGDVAWVIDRAHHDWGDLDENRDRMVAIVRAVEAEVEPMRDGEVRAHPGEHCGYCPAAPSCPARWSLAEAVRARLASGGVARLVAEMPPAEVGALVRQLDALEALIPPLRQAVRERVKAAPVPLGDGKRIVWGRRDRERVDPAKAREVLARLFGDAVAAEAVPAREVLETSKDRIGATLGPLRERVGRRKLVRALDGRQMHVDDVLDELRAAGATRDEGYMTEIVEDEPGEAA